MSEKIWQKVKRWITAERQRVNAGNLKISVCQKKHLLFCNTTLQIGRGLFGGRNKANLERPRILG